MGLLRYGLALILGTVTNAAVFVLLESQAWTPTPPAGLLASVAGLIVCILVNEAGASRVPFDRRRLRPTLIIAAGLQVSLMLYTLSRFPDIQPLAANIISGLSGMCFAMVGYWRFFHRIG